MIIHKCTSATNNKDHIDQEISLLHSLMKQWHRRMSDHLVYHVNTNYQPTTTIKIAEIMTITKIEVIRRTIDLQLWSRLQDDHDCQDFEVTSETGEKIVPWQFSPLSLDLCIEKRGRDEREWREGEVWKDLSTNSNPHDRGFKIKPADPLRLPKQSVRSTRNRSDSLENSPTKVLVSRSDRGVHESRQKSWTQSDPRKVDGTRSNRQTP